MQLKPYSTLLFIGDSITDVGRSRDDDSYLGNGYVNLLSAQLRCAYPQADLHIYNRGISGNRAIDLRVRWQQDCIALKPDFLTIFIGINDTWRRYDSNDPTSCADFERDYRAILVETVAKTSAKLILMEPFVLPTPSDRIAWREDLDPKIQVVRRLAAEFQACLLPLDGIFASASMTGGPAYWAADGVHPTPAGHALIANTWMQTFEQIIG